MSDRSLHLPNLRGRVAALFILTLLIPSVELVAQQGVVAVEENFRSEPNGLVLGRLERGTRVEVTGSDGNWTRVALEGFIWTASMQVREGGLLDLVVTEPDGEVVRDEPSGRIAGSLSSGTLLEEVERVPGWVRVRRTGWIWTASLDIQEEDTGEDDATFEEPSDSDDGAGAREEAAAENASESAGTGGLELRSEPGGEPVGRVLDTANVRVVDYEGAWARVRVEGWIRRSDLGADGGDEIEGEVHRGVLAEDIAREPDRYEGRLVELELEFISLEEAEEIRRDFSPGEPFLLARAVEGSRAFVYVTVPRERRDEMAALTPLEGIRVLGRVRSGAAAFTGSPIIELLELQRIP